MSIHSDDEAKAVLAHLEPNNTNPLWIGYIGMSKMIEVNHKISQTKKTKLGYIEKARSVKWTADILKFFSEDSLGVRQIWSWTDGSDSSRYTQIGKRIIQMTSTRMSLSVH